MRINLPGLFYRLRRKILKKVVPEFVWPRSISIDKTEIPVRGMPYSFGIKRTLSKGKYEDSERALIKEIIQKGDQVIELGGSIGIMSAIMSEMVGKEGLIISVEASEKLAKSASIWLESKGNVKVMHGIGFPVWETPVKFLDFQFLDEGNSLGGQVVFKAGKNGDSKVFQTYDLKQLITNYNIVPKHLIIDIEGTEIVFLEDGIAIPVDIKNIVIEMHPNLYGQDTEDLIIKKLRLLGFSVVKELRHVFLLTRGGEMH